MLRLICAAALAAMAAGPAFAQKTDLPDRALKQITPFDQGPIKEGLTTLKQGGECTVDFIVGVDGKAKDMKADCTVPDMAPYAIRTVESGVWEAEITGGEFFDSFPLKRIFKFGTTAAADPRGEKAPVLKTDLQPKDIARAISQVDESGVCNVKYSVGADGKVKDVSPNCQPAAYDGRIIEAMKRMEYEPGLKDGKPVDWPGMSMPMNLTKPKG